MKKLYKITFSSLLIFLLLISSLFPAGATVVNVDNLAPVAGFDVGKRKIVELQLSVGENNYTADEWESKVNTLLKPKLNENGIDLVIDVKSLELDIENIKQRVASGGFHNLFLINGEVYGLGYNGTYALGSSQEDFETPTKIPNIPTKIVSVSAGDNFSALLDEFGEVYTSGNNVVGQTGFSNNNPQIKNFTKLETPVKIKQIAAGRNHLALLGIDNQVYSVGYNEYGALGDPNLYVQYTHVITKMVGINNVEHISAGNSVTVMRRTDGSWWYVGLNAQQFETAAVFTRTPRQINIEGIKDIKTSGWSVSYSGSPVTHRQMPIIFMNDGTAYWGGYHFTQELVTNGTSGLDHFLLVTERGRVYGRGDNTYSQLGNNKEKINYQDPTLIQGLENVIYASANDYTSLFVLNDGTVKVLGGGGNGQLGKPVGEVSTPRLLEGLPSLIPSPKYSPTENILFTGLVDDTTQFSVETISEELEELNSNFIGIGNDSNKEKLNQIIKDNDSNGTYIDNTKIDTAIQELADYIIAEVSARKTIDLQVAVGETPYTKDQIEGKLNSLLKPRLLEEKIKVNLIVNSVTTKTSQIDWEFDSGYFVGRYMAATSLLYQRFYYTDRVINRYGQGDIYAEQEALRNTFDFSKYIYRLERSNAKTEITQLPFDVYSKITWPQSIFFYIYRKAKSDYKPWEDVAKVRIDDIINTSLDFDLDEVNYEYRYFLDYGSSTYTPITKVDLIATSPDNVSFSNTFVLYGSTENEMNSKNNYINQYYPSYIKKLQIKQSSKVGSGNPYLVIQKQQKVAKPEYKIQESENPSFYALVNDAIFEGVDTLNSELSKTNANFIGLGTTTNQSQMEQIITANNGQGVFLEAYNETKSKAENEALLDAAMENMANHIIDVLKNEMKVDLLFGIGDTIHNNKDAISTKIESLIRPKLNDEGIKIQNINFLNTNATIGKSTLGYGLHNYYSSSGYPTDTLGTRFKTDHDIYIYNVSVSLVHIGQSFKIGIWNDLGMLLTQAESITYVNGLNEVELSKPLHIKANKDYYIGVLSNSDKKTSDGGSFGLTETVDGVNFDIQTTLRATNGFRKPTFEESMSYGPLFQLDFSKSLPYQDLNLNKSSTKFISFLEDNPINEERKNQLLGNSLLNNAFAVGLGNNNNNTTFQEIISANMDRGKFINNNNIDSSLTQLADYIIETTKKEHGIHEIYLTLEEEAEYFTYYEDAEKDPKFAERWRYNHKPTVFEHDMGLASFHLRDLVAPVTKFSKVGRYQTFYAARDNPIYWNDEAFDNYRKWSKEADNWYIYVHRKPVPNFSFTINGSTGDYSITNKAYDLDKQSIDIGFGGGLRDMFYQWRLQGESSWKEGLPPNPLERKVYEVKQTVTDFQGATESIIRLMDGTGINKPPIADFDPIPDEIIVGESTTLVNKSYDPNGDPLRYEWFMSKDKTNWTQFSTEEHPVKQLDEVGEYWFKVKAIETNMNPALSDESEPKKVTVLQNNQGPEAGFICKDNPTCTYYIGDKIEIISTATDPDGDVLDFEYMITKTGNSPIQFKTGDNHVSIDGNVAFVLPDESKNIGKWEILQTVTDGKELATAGPKTLTILDLEIDGNVAHTEDWEKIHSNKGTINPLDFYSGEKFLLSAVTTPKAAKEVKVEMVFPLKNGTTLKPSTNLSKVSNALYKGDYSNALFAEPSTAIKKGTEMAIFKFTVIFDNESSITRTDTVKVNIIGDALEALDFHQRY